MERITEKLVFELKLKRTNQEKRIISKPLEYCYKMQKPTKNTRRNGRFEISYGNILINFYQAIKKLV